MLALCIGFVCGLLSARLVRAYLGEDVRRERQPHKRIELSEDPRLRQARRIELAEWNGRPLGRTRD